MNRADIHKLLGGYATGTLTDAERKALFEAALEDQALFDSIAGDGALKELFDDPQARAQLLAALPAKPELVAKQMAAWNWAAVASVAATLVIGAFLLRMPVPLKFAERRATAPLPMNEQVQPPATFQAEPGPRLAKQKTLAPAPVPTERASAKSFPSAPAVPLPQSDRDGPNPAENDLKHPADKEPAASVAVAEDRRKKVGQPVSVDAVRAQPALAAQSGVSNVLSTTAGGPQPLLDRAAQNQQSARQIFYSPVYDTDVAAGFVAGRYDAPSAGKRPVTQTGTPGLRYTLLRREADGSYLETDPTTSFHAGDAIRLSIETNAAGYLAVWNGRVSLANLSVLARTKYTVPAEGAIGLTGPPGDKKLLVIFSRAVQTKPAGLVGGLLVEQSNERATYVADTRPSALVSFEINLTYR